MFQGHKRSFWKVDVVSQVMPIGKEKYLELLLRETRAPSKGPPHPSEVLQNCSSRGCPFSTLIWTFTSFFSSRFSMSLLKAIYAIVFNYPHFPLLQASRRFLLQEIGPSLRLYEDSTVTIPYDSKPFKGHPHGFPMSSPLLCLFSTLRTLPTYCPQKRRKRKVCSMTPVRVSNPNLAPSTFRLAQPSVR